MVSQKRNYNFFTHTCKLFHLHTCYRKLQSLYQIFAYFKPHDIFLLLNAVVWSTTIQGQHVNFVFLDNFFTYYPSHFAKYPFHKNGQGLHGCPLLKFCSIPCVEPKKYCNINLRFVNGNGMVVYVFVLF
jgi:hypothetical protein